MLLFLIVPALGIVSPLIALPALTAAHGADAWASIAVGLSLGSGGAVIAELGWGLTGPQRVARTTPLRARYYFALSLVTKLFSVAPIMLVSGVLVFVLFPLNSSLAVLAAVSGTANGLNQNWFFIGRGSPGMILYFDTIPRVGFVVISAVLMALGLPPELYVIVGLLTPSLLSPVLAAFFLGIRPADLSRWRCRRLFRIMRFQIPAVSGRMASALYIALPSALVGLVSPVSVGTFAAVERVTRMFLSLLAAIPNYLQKFVGEVSTLKLKVSRTYKSLLICTLVGAVSGIFFAFILPFVSQIIFAGTVRVTPGQVWLASGVVFIVCVSRATGNIGLVTVRRIRSITRSAMLGAVLGLPSIVMLGIAWGATGALLGMLAAEIAVLTYQLFAFWRAVGKIEGLRTRPSPGIS